uniref:Uncharacterized protein n=2 Tax=Rhabditophanes sp. KR3021 TaxID=114890 RepID=A0AC35U8C8_9BILA
MDTINTPTVQPDVMSDDCDELTYLSFLQKNVVDFLGKSYYSRRRGDTPFQVKQFVVFTPMPPPNPSKKSHFAFPESWKVEANQAFLDSIINSNTKQNVPSAPTEIPFVLSEYHETFPEADAPVTKTEVPKAADNHVRERQRLSSLLNPAILAFFARNPASHIPNQTELNLFARQFAALRQREVHAADVQEEDIDVEISGFHPGRDVAVHVADVFQQINVDVHAVAVYQEINVDVHVADVSQEINVDVHVAEVSSKINVADVIQEINAGINVVAVFHEMNVDIHAANVHQGMDVAVHVADGNQEVVDLLGTDALVHQAVIIDLNVFGKNSVIAENNGSVRQKVVGNTDGAQGLHSTSSRPDNKTTR